MFNFLKSRRTSLFRGLEESESRVDDAHHRRPVGPNESSSSSHGRPPSPSPTYHTLNPHRPPSPTPSYATVIPDRPVSPAPTYHTIDNNSHAPSSSTEAGPAAGEAPHTRISDLPRRKWIIDEPLPFPGFAMNFSPADFHTSDDYDRIIAHLASLTTSAPNDLCHWRNLAEAHEFKALSYSSAGYNPHEDLDRAIQAWESGLRICADARAEFRMCIGRLHARKGDYDAAIAVFEPVVEGYELPHLRSEEFETNSIKPWLWEDLGDAYRRRGDYERAIVGFRKLMARPNGGYLGVDWLEAPRQCAGWKGIGHVNMEKGDYLEAVRAYRRACLINGSPALQRYLRDAEKAAGIAN